jgi:hypothetical protein
MVSIVILYLLIYLDLHVIHVLLLFCFSLLSQKTSQFNTLQENTFDTKAYCFHDSTFHARCLGLLHRCIALSHFMLPIFTSWRCFEEITSDAQLIGQWHRQPCSCPFLAFWNLKLRDRSQVEATTTSYFSKTPLHVATRYTRTAPYPSIISR